MAQAPEVLMLFRAGHNDDPSLQIVKEYKTIPRPMMPCKAGSLLSVSRQALTVFALIRYYELRMIVEWLSSAVQCSVEDNYQTPHKPLFAQSVR